MYAPPVVLFAAAGLLIGFGVVLLLQPDPLMALVMFAFAALILFGHAYVGTVFRVGRSIQQGRFDRAERQLRQTWNPRWLAKRLRGYYWFFGGLIHLKARRLPQAREAFDRALRWGLANPSENALLHVQMARTCLHLQHATEARLHATRARGFALNEEMQTVVADLERDLGIPAPANPTYPDAAPATT
jgi:hypothetical protein